MALKPRIEASKLFRSPLTTGKAAGADPFAAGIFGATGGGGGGETIVVLLLLDVVPLSFVLDSLGGITVDWRFDFFPDEDFFTEEVFAGVFLTLLLALSTGVVELLVFLGEERVLEQKSF